ncbi:MAG: FAD-dependent oxidoreductase [Pseudomonadota bacterium]
MKIAIIGAGLSGLVLATRLSLRHQVTVFEKARGPGGRMSTRRANRFGFDHGAQYFTAESDAFKRFIETYRAEGLIEIWPETISLYGDAKVSSKTKWVAAPGMNAICKAFAKQVELQTGFHVEALEREPSGWRVIDKMGSHVGPFDWVISTAPAPQSAAVLPDTFSGQEALARVRMSGCFSLMLGFDKPLNLPWDAYKSGDPPIGWITLNSDKPRRNNDPSLLIQSSNEWAETYLEGDPDDISKILLDAAADLIEQDLSDAVHQSLHRWRYAATPQPAGVPFLMDEDLNLAACGDWCLGSKIESAFLSADALARAWTA